MKKRIAALLMLLHLLPAHAGDRNPLDVPLREWLMWLTISVGAGLVSWLGKVRRGELAAHQLLLLAGELSCSVMAGMLTWALAELADTPKLATVALVAISGHLGTRAIVILERWGERQMQRLTGDPEPPPNRTDSGV